MPVGAAPAVGTSRITAGHTGFVISPRISFPFSDGYQFPRNNGEMVLKGVHSQGFLPLTEFLKLLHYFQKQRQDTNPCPVQETQTLGQLQVPTHKVGCGHAQSFRDLVSNVTKCQNQVTFC